MRNTSHSAHCPLVQIGNCCFVYTVRKSTLWSDIPTAGESLQYIKSLARRPIFFPVTKPKKHKKSTTCWELNNLKHPDTQITGRKRNNKAELCYCCGSFKFRQSFIYCPSKGIPEFPKRNMPLRVLLLTWEDTKIWEPHSGSQVRQFSEVEKNISNTMTLWVFVNS